MSLLPGGVIRQVHWIERPRTICKEKKKRFFLDYICIKFFFFRPISLRPPSYNFSYAPVILQTLFHISAFQHAVLSFRPIPSSWGSTSNYWKGQGEPMPGYITIKKVVQQNSEDLTKDESEYNDINESAVQEDILEEEEEEEKGWVEAEVKSLPKCLQVLGEMQKLFAFLGNTKRQYGNVSDYTKALNTRSNWEEDEIQFECKYKKGG